MKSFTKTILFCLFIFSLIALVPASSAIGEGWLDGWDHRQGITITGSIGAGTNYQIMLDVTYDANMQADFDDIRFTAANGVTELDYWCEDYTASTDAIFWVEVADNLNTTQEIYMYYGNDAVSTTSDGDDTFLFFDDFNDASIDPAKWTEDGATESGGYLSLAVGNKWLGSVDHVQSGTAIEARTKQAGARKHNLGYANTWAVSNPQWIHHAFDGDTFMYEGNTDTGTKSYPLDTYCIESIYWKDVDEGEYDVDRAGRQDRDDADIPDSDMHVGAQTWGSSTAAYIIDWIFVRSWIETEPIALFGLWNDLTPAMFLFSVPFDMWGMDTALIILGLVMIPTSTIYLAYGAKHDRSSDRLFYGLILFFLGCGLFIGGILP